MATYTPIIGTETDPDAPLTSSLAKRWSDNWIAGFEGQANAPKLKLTALDRPTPGGNWRLVFPNSSPALNTSVQHSFGICQYGSIRIEATMGGGANSPTLSMYRTRATSQVLFYQQGGTGYRVVDIAVIPGDLITILASPGGGSSVQLTNVHVMTGGEYLFPLSSFGSYFGF